MRKTIVVPFLLFALGLGFQYLAIPVSAQTNTCPSAHFLNVQPDPANSAYPDPELNVTCAANSFTVTSNGIPNYEFVPITPGQLTARNNSWTITLTPTGSQASIPLLGDVAVLVNGIPIYGPNEGGNLGYGDPYLDNLLDFCSGHVGPTGYHNHAMAECIIANYENNVGTVVGYALDGWPILTPFECADAGCTTFTELQSSWQLTNPAATAAWDKHSYVEGSGDLDECNGKVQPDGTYAYYATETFPYFLGCYVHAEFAPPLAIEMAYLPLVGNGFNSQTAVVLPSLASLGLVTWFVIWKRQKATDTG